MITKTIIEYEIGDVLDISKILSLNAKGRFDEQPKVLILRRKKWRGAEFYTVLTSQYKIFGLTADKLVGAEYAGHIDLKTLSGGEYCD